MSEVLVPNNGASTPEQMETLEPTKGKPAGDPDDGARYSVVLAPRPAGPSPAESEIARLIQTYSPALVLFPEVDGPPPYSRDDRDAGGDYHPRTADIYLNDAQVLERPVVTALVKPFLMLLAFATPWVIVAALLSGLEISVDLRDFDFGALAVPVGVASIYVVGRLVVVFSDKIGPRGGEKIAQLLAQNFDDALVSAKLANQADANEAWKAYWKVLSERPQDFPRTAYIHLVARPPTTEGGAELLVIQYWFFYFYNHFWNTHEADWELVNVFLTTDKDGEYEPRAVACSTHMEARWREWEQVSCAPAYPGEEQQTHPLIYVARGSHANYFGPSDVGYASWASVRVAGGKMQWPRRLARWFFVKGMPGGAGVQLRFALNDAQGQGRDVVPSVKPEDVTLDDALSYRLIDLPADPEELIPANQTLWKEWWWLQFKGSWCSDGGPVVGPWHQGTRWSSPWTWAGSGSPDAIDGWRHVLAKSRPGTETPRVTHDRAPAG